MFDFNSKSVRNIVVGVLLILFLANALIAFFSHQDTIAERSHFWSFAVEYHAVIMASMAFVALLLGLVGSQYFYKEIKRIEKDTQSILGVVLLFLNKEEREIVNHLVSHNGQTSQAEIARLPHMNRVRAHRALQKMQEKQIIEIIPHGKVRRVKLKENILKLLLEK